MVRNDWIEAVKEELPVSRWHHTQGVMETALRIAKDFGANSEQTEIAALFHDYCKFWTPERLKATILEAELSTDLLDYPAALWHAPVGAYVVQQRFGIDDREILDAIRYHTSGRPHMTLLDKVIFVADYIEPGRRFPGVQEVREMAHNNLDQALLKALENTMGFLLEQQGKIYPLTLKARNFLVDSIHQPTLKEESL